ncbi:MAG: PspC domain-containing protein [Propionibacteriaceae bacterium]|jgi:signal transduction histidine kinase/phage shock protein PspC (stress-responsive transcriptional regulator)|nr:PspC domain-containing protein [Propionibacteriaceae bacterium]
MTVEAQAKESKRTTRPLEKAWIGGVCAALARQFNLPVLAVRLVFMLLLGTTDVGIVVYFFFWICIPPEYKRRSAALDTATRSGQRAKASNLPQLTSSDYAQIFAFAILYIGVIWLLQLFLGNPLDELAQSALLFLGMGLIWWVADHASARKTGVSGARRFIQPFISHWTSLLLVLLGVVLLALSGIWTDGLHRYLYPRTRIDDVQRLILWAVWLVLVLGAAVLPFFVRNRRELARARVDKEIADTRADMAAHLHDSVLQTLALIQRSAGDERQVLQLARKQERELRNYLYGELDSKDSLLEALNEVAADVEERYGQEVEVVNVGDTEMDERLEDMVAAAREAAQNAAKHSGEEHIDIFLEVDGNLVEVFVRDRGAGFDLAHIDSDRMGVRESIMERMARCGGRAIIKTAPGEGTEVRLELSK